jgi:hypothetical protein
MSHPPIASLSPDNPEPFAFLSELCLQMGRRDQAASSARQVLALPARNPLAREAQIRAAELLTKLSTEQPLARPSTPSYPNAALTPPPASAGAKGNRVALVVGNSNYVNAGQLKNPSHDAHLIASTLLKIGFTAVKELYDLALRESRGGASAETRYSRRLSEQSIHRAHGALGWSLAGQQWWAPGAGARW